MKAVTFNGATSLLGQHQPNYKTLPAHVTGTDIPGVQEYTFKMELSDLEIAQIIKTRSFFFTQVGSCFHPIDVALHNPLYSSATVTIMREDPDFYQASVSDTLGDVHIFGGATAEGVIDAITDHFHDVVPDSIKFVQEEE